MSRRFVGLLCPACPEHGKLLDWSSERWGFYCPHRDHEGRPAKGVAPTRAFFRTEEAEAGALDRAHTSV